MSTRASKEVATLVISGLTLNSLGVISIVTAVYGNNNFTLILAAGLILIGSVFLGIAVKKSFVSK